MISKLKNFMKIFNNKTYLITGGTGSFGSTMVKDLLKKKILKKLEYLVGTKINKKNSD